MIAHDKIKTLENNHFHKIISYSYLIKTGGKLCHAVKEKKENAKGKKESNLKIWGASGAACRPEAVLN